MFRAHIKICVKYVLGFAVLFWQSFFKLGCLSAHLISREIKELFDMLDVIGSQH